jgi:hypothetical protein
MVVVSGPAPNSPNQVAMRCSVNGRLGHSTPGKTDSEMQEADENAGDGVWQ